MGTLTKNSLISAKPTDVVWMTSIVRFLQFFTTGCNQFHTACLFVNPLKTLENQRFSDVFRGYRKRPVAWNVLERVAEKFFWSVHLKNSETCTWNYDSRPISLFSYGAIWTNQSYGTSGQNKRNNVQAFSSIFEHFRVLRVPLGSREKPWRFWRSMTLKAINSVKDHSRFGTIRVSEIWIFYNFLNVNDKICSQRKVLCFLFRKI